MQAVEVSARIDQNGHLTLAKPLKMRAGQKVRVIVLIADDAEISDAEWLKAASVNPVFDFLDDAAEDVYSLEDGQPMPSK